ncbi:MAG: hypothetical protein QM775_16965 [Pirellulales bacterium]
MAPAREATSTIRSPNTPLTQTIIESPGSIRLTTVLSMPADPVALIAIVIGFCVRKSVRNMLCMSLISAR